MAKRVGKGDRSFDPANPRTCINPDLDGEKDMFKRSGDWVQVDKLSSIEDFNKGKIGGVEPGPVTVFNK